MNYDQVIKNIQTLAEIPLNQEDENFKRIIPLMFTYADNRIYRELEFLATTAVVPGQLMIQSGAPHPVRYWCWEMSSGPTGYDWAGLTGKSLTARRRWSVSAPKRWT
jgi:hypothetical protein